MPAARRFLRNTVAVALVAAAVTVAPRNASAEPTTDAKPRHGRTVAAVSIPAIDLDVQRLYGIRDAVLARGLGLWSGTSLLGRPGNAVVAGHRASHGAPIPCGSRDPQRPRPPRFSPAIPRTRLPTAT